MRIIEIREKPVSLYGFWPFCCHGGAAARINYKYFQGNRTRFVCCSRGREKMEAEYALYRQLDRRGIVKLQRPPERLRTQSRARQT